LPDAESSFFNPDLKVYTTNIYVDSDGNSLRTGMSCRAEIIVAQYEDAVYVPVQAVLRVGRQPTVYVVNGKTFAPREVEIGLDNGRMVRIVRGLQENEVVLLSPPLAAATAEPLTGKEQTEMVPVTTGKVEGGTVEKGPSEQKPVRKDEAAPAEGGPPSQGMESPSAEQMQKMRQRFENMSPEEQQKEMEKMKQRFENMSPEEREQMKQRFQGSGGRRQGGRQGQDPNQRPERNQ
jgi:hypothetical protein